MRRMVAGLAALVVMTACTDQLPGFSDGDDEAPDVTVAATAPKAVDANENPEGDPSVLVDLVVTWLNGSDPSESFYEELFDDQFRAAVPFGAFVGVLDPLRDRAPWTRASDLGFEAGSGAALVQSDDGERFVITAGFGEGGQVSLLAISPGPASSIGQALGLLRSQGRTTWVTAAVEGDRCIEIEIAGGDEVVPVASAFKLYVLAALVDAIAVEEVAWDQLVEIRDELDSLPSGDTQNRRPGSQMSVRRLAEWMIAASDNTATDHLIDLLGRERVEAALSTHDHHNPDATLPLLTTREQFNIRLGWSADQIDVYVRSDVEARRGLLAADAAATPDIEQAVGWTAPRNVRDIGWFATARDLCRVIAGLSVDPAAREILALSPGVPDLAGRWDYIGFKGGSEVGVLTAVWLLEETVVPEVEVDEEADEDTEPPEPPEPELRTYVVVGSVVNEQRALDETAAIMQLSALRDLLDPG